MTGRESIPALVQRYRDALRLPADALSKLAAARRRLKLNLIDLDRRVGGAGTHESLETWGAQYLTALQAQTTCQALYMLSDGEWVYWDRNSSQLLYHGAHRTAWDTCVTVRQEILLALIDIETLLPGVSREMGVT